MSGIWVFGKRRTIIMIILELPWPLIKEEAQSSEVLRTHSLVRGSYDYGGGGMRKKCVYQKVNIGPDSEHTAWVHCQSKCESKWVTTIWSAYLDWFLRFLMKSGLWVMSEGSQSPNELHIIISRPPLIDWMHSVGESFQESYNHRPHENMPPSLPPPTDWQT